MTTNLPWAAADPTRPWTSTLLHWLATALNAAGQSAARAAERTATASMAPAIETVEFHELHRDAGAPEGALYINGQLVAILPGVTRL